MLNTRIGLMLCVGALMVLSAHASATEHPCAGVVEGAARLACYDEAFPPVNDAQVPRLAGKSDETLKADFGLSIREVDERKPESERDARLDSIQAVVQRIQTVRGGQRVLTLDNGQIWQLTEGGSKGLLSSGDEIIIRRALFGSYMLTTPGGVGLRARRVH